MHNNVHGTDTFEQPSRCSRSDAYDDDVDVHVLMVMMMIVPGHPGDNKNTIRYTRTPTTALTHTHPF